jgi:hypothetical protein
MLLLPVIVAAPWKLPVRLGVKVTLKVHLAPTARLVPQGAVPPAVTEKSTLPVKDKEVSIEPELFVKVRI